MSSNQTSSDQNQNVGSVAGEIKASLGLDDVLNNLGTSTSSASSGLTTGNWGSGSNTLNMGGGDSLSFKQVALFGGLAIFGWLLIKKIGSK